eukprot:scaffold103534_cov74-Phaeocystis_antarctica.AAC.3
MSVTFQRGAGCKFKERLIIWTFNRRTHPVSLILVHAGVGQRCRARDVEAPAMLPTTRAHVTALRGFNAKTHFARRPKIARSSTPRDVQPYQLSPASGRHMNDPPRALGVEHDAPGHLRLDGHVAVDAERRTA